MVFRGILILKEVENEGLRHDEEECLFANIAYKIPSVAIVALV